LFNIIEVVIDHQLLIEREQWWIDRLDSANKKTGFNLNLRAESSLGTKYSEEGRQNVSKSMMGKGHPHTPESRRKISEALHGKKHSEEHRRKLSESTQGRPVSEEAKRKISAFFKGRKSGPKSDETKRKLSEAKRGRKLSEEHKRKISEGLRRNGPKVNPNALLVAEDVAIIKNLLSKGVKGCDIARNYGVSRGVISDIKRGHTWSYVLPNDN
jgi:group I intron endonuclease